MINRDINKKQTNNTLPKKRLIIQGNVPINASREAVLNQLNNQMKRPTPASNTNEKPLLLSFAFFAITTPKESTMIDPIKK